MISEGDYLYCIKDLCVYEEDEESKLYKFLFEPFDTFLGKFDDLLDRMNKGWLKYIFNIVFIFFIIQLFILYLLTRRWTFKKLLIFKCNNKYQVSEITHDGNIIEMYDRHDNYQKLVLKRRFKKVEEWIAPVLKTHFVDFKTFRKSKLKKLKPWKNII